MLIRNNVFYQLEWLSFESSYQDVGNGSGLLENFVAYDTQNIVHLVLAKAEMFIEILSHSNMYKSNSLAEINK